MLAMGGENRREHLNKKDGPNLEARQQARKTLTKLGHDVEFAFHFFAEMRIYKTRKANPLLLWAHQTAKPMTHHLDLRWDYFQLRKETY